MTTRDEAIAACGAFAGVYEDYPFHDPAWTVMRHQSNRKIFAMIFERQGHIWINVKAEPQWADFWRGAFEAVVPAYHMNKQHWVSIILNGTMPEEEIRRLIQESYALTAPRHKKGKARR